MSYHADVAPTVAPDVFEVTPTPREKNMAYIAEVAARHQTTAAAVLGESRARYVVDARREIAMHLHGQGLSSVQIGRLMNRDHTSILNLLGATKSNRRKRVANYLRGECPVCAERRQLEDAA
jgi:chromosomal replication initiation ATPase DnaA